MSENGGPAPSPKAEQLLVTLRDYFAGQALAGLLADGLRDKRDDDDIAEVAYGMADAMLNERERP